MTITTQEIAKHDILGTGNQQVGTEAKVTPKQTRDEHRLIIFREQKKQNEVAFQKAGVTPALFETRESVEPRVEAKQGFLQKLIARITPKPNSRF